MTPEKQRILARRGFKMTVVSMKAALNAEEMPFSSASRQQNMHFDLKSALDAEDMSVSSGNIHHDELVKTMRVDEATQGKGMTRKERFQY